jgi:C4-dicarboxylate-binding protein DctP
MNRFHRVPRRTTALVLGALLVGLLAALPATTAAQAPVASWKCFLYNPAPHPFAKAMMQWADEVKAKSQGRLEIKVFPAGELPYRVNQSASIVGNRLVELSDANGTFLEGEMPIASLIEMPYLMATIDQHRRAMKVFEPYLNAAAARFDAELLFWYGYPVKHLIGRRTAPRTLEDLRGTKIRTLGALPAGALSALGMTSVTMPPGEVPVALQRGVMQGTTSAWFYVVSSKWHEQLNWSYNMNLGTTSSFILVNRTALKALPADLQGLLRETGAKYGQSMLDQSYRLEADSGEVMRKAGFVFVDPTPEDARLMETRLGEFAAQWAKRLGKEGEEALARMREAVR